MNENLVTDVLESAENLLASSITSAMGMISAVAPDQALGIVRALIDDQLAFAVKKKIIKKHLQ